MFRRSLEIAGNSFRMALQELWKNKLRTFLSLFGITIGIFCIIGVLVTVNSLEANIQREIKSLGTNTLYLDKWDYTGGPDYPRWKFVNRPVPKYAEIKMIRERTPRAAFIAYKIGIQDNIEYNGNQLSNINVYGVSEDFDNIQDVTIVQGRFISQPEFERGINSCVIGYTAAEKLFGIPEAAVGKQINARGSKTTIIGVIKKQGNQFLGGWNFDQSIVLPYNYAKFLMKEDNSNPVIMIQGLPDVSSKSLKEDLTGTVRAIHKLSPNDENNFSLNDINDFSAAVSSLFAGVNIGGWAIAALSLIVGMFGVANIMFVSVRERTGQIGLKKAIGAKRRVILTEFLLESAFLCIIGGLIGLTLVYGLAALLTSALHFPVTVSTGYIMLAIGICIFVGVLAGFIPALQASKLDPVVAIRSK